MKVLLKRFHLNGHTIGFDAQTQKLELPQCLHKLFGKIKEHRYPCLNFLERFQADRKLSVTKYGEMLLMAHL